MTVSKMRDELSAIDGLYVGMLTVDEIEMLNHAVAEGRAIRSYEGPGGLLGMAKVRVLPVPSTPN